MIACGGTALTLLGYKPSTLDVDLLVPEADEYQRLINFLKRAGYEPIGGHRWKRPGEILVFDLFAGNAVFTTNLLESSLAPGRNRKIKEFKKIYLGVLNSTDLIITKLFRGTGPDMEDCRLLVESETIDLDALKERYQETARYETGENKVLRNLEIFLQRIKKSL